MPLYFPTTVEFASGVYGDASDGAQTFDGSSVILGITPSANAYTLARDIFLANASVINTGVSIITNGFRIFCAGTLTNNGTIKWNGAAGTVGGAGGAAIGNTNSNINISATIGAAGGAGATGSGSAGSSQAARAYGGGGGLGGGGATGAAGAAGTVTVPLAKEPQLRFVPASVFGTNLPGSVTVSLFFGGAGGGGGGGDTTNAGGGGGGGGGIVVVTARFISGTGAIQARGGAGGNGAVASTLGAGGGGGGGGGLVVVTSSSVVVGSPNSISGQTIDAAGGAPGALQGATGGPGIIGSAGTVILVPN